MPYTFMISLQKNFSDWESMFCCKALEINTYISHRSNWKRRWSRGKQNWISVGSNILAEARTTVCHAMSSMTLQFKLYGVVVWKIMYGWLVILDFHVVIVDYISNRLSCFSVSWMWIWRTMFSTVIPKTSKSTLTNPTQAIFTLTGLTSLSALTHWFYIANMRYSSNPNKSIASTSCSSQRPSRKYNFRFQLDREGSFGMLSRCWSDVITVAKQQRGFSSFINPTENFNADIGVSHWWGSFWTDRQCLRDR